LANAKALQNDYEGTLRKVEDLDARKMNAENTATRVKNTLAEANGRARVYNDLILRKGLNTEQIKTLKAQYSELENKIKAISQIRSDLEGTRKELGKIREDLPLLNREVLGLESEASKTKVTLEDIRKKRLQVDQAEADTKNSNDFNHVKENVKQLSKRISQIEKAHSRLSELKKQRTKIVAPDRKTLRSIRQTYEKLRDAQVRLDAVLLTLEIDPEKAGSIEILSAEEIGMKKLVPKKPTQIKGSPEIVVRLPGIARIRAYGPTGSVDELRDERDRALQKIKKLTEGFPTTNPDELESITEKIEALDEEIDNIETEVGALLQGLSDEEILQERAKLNITLEGILSLYPQWQEKAPDADALRKTYETTRSSFVGEVENAETDWQKAEAALRASTEKRAKLSEQEVQLQRNETNFDEKLHNLTNDGLTDEVRVNKLNELSMDFRGANASLVKIDEQIKGFGQDPNTEVAKLEKQLRSLNEDTLDLLGEQRQAHGHLAGLAAQGPYSLLVEVEEQIAEIEKQIEVENSRVAAVKLLFDTTKECRAEVLSKISGPVERVASRILTRISGSKFARLQFSEEFGADYIIPEVADILVPLTQISGGEKEQVRFATRLALANAITTNDHQLVVLDDAVTYSDLARLARIMSILEEEAQRFQILVLTCHPEWYQGLEGAKFIDLEVVIRESITV